MKRKLKAKRPTMIDVLQAMARNIAELRTAEHARIEWLERQVMALNGQVESLRNELQLLKNPPMVGWWANPTSMQAGEQITPKVYTFAPRDGGTVGSGG